MRFRRATRADMAEPSGQRQRLTELVAQKTDELSTALAAFTAPQWEAIIPTLTPDEEGLKLALQLAEISITSIPARIAQALIGQTGNALAQFQFDRIFAAQIPGSPAAAQFADVPEWLRLGADTLLRGELTPADALYQALNNRRTVAQVVSQLERIIAEKLLITIEAAAVLIQQAIVSLETPILIAIREAIKTQLERVFQRAVDEGMTIPQFREEARGMLPSATDANLETEFRTGMAERFAERSRELFDRAGNRVPYLQWLAITDDRARPTHAAMHKVVAARDSETWRQWQPPAGYNCRCTLSPIGYLEAIRRGWAKREGNRLVITGGEYPAGPPPRFVVDPKSGKTLEVKPDPGFDGRESRAA